MSEAAALWNGPGGEAWVELQEQLDRMFAPLRDLIVDELLSLEARRVLEVGCGTGDVVLEAKRALGREATVTGVDISEPMLDLARSRAIRDGVDASFVLADAQTHSFEPHSFDAVVSRFGVMFFDDPVAAFSNIREAMSPGGRARLVVWRDREENPFVTESERAVESLLPEPFPEPPPDAPGMFGLAREGYVRDVFDRAGWTDVELRPVDATCTVPRGDLSGYVTNLGPAGRFFQAADAQTRAAFLERVNEAYERYIDGDTVSFSAACWLICAVAA